MNPTNEELNRSHDEARKLMRHHQRFLLTDEGDKIADKKTILDAFKAVMTCVTHRRCVDLQIAGETFLEDIERILQEDIPEK